MHIFNRSMRSIARFNAEGRPAPGPARALAVLAWLLAMAHAALAGTVCLRSSTAHPGTGPITLAQIATVSGDDATRWADTVIVADAAARFASSRLTTVELDEVRRALRGAGAPIGRLALSGSACVVRLSTPAPAAEPAPVEAPVEEPERPFEPAIIDEHDTLRRRVAERLAQLHDADPADVRVRLSAVDRAYLDTLCGSDTVVAEPTSSAASPRPAVSVRVIRDGRVTSSRAMMIEVEVRRRVLVLRHEVSRGRTLSENDIDFEDRWVVPSHVPVLTDPGAAVGGRAKNRLEAGRVLSPGDVDPPTVVEKGDLVQILCYTEGLELKTRARALAAGRIGDSVEFRIEGSTRSFFAIIDAPGRAVCDTRSASGGGADSGGGGGVARGTQR